MKTDYINLLEQAADDYYFDLIFKAGIDYKSNSKIFNQVCDKLTKRKNYEEDYKIQLVFEHLKNSKNIEDLLIENIKKSVDNIFNDKDAILKKILKEFKNYDMDKETPIHNIDRHMSMFEIFSETFFLQKNFDSLNTITNIIGTSVEVLNKYKTELELNEIFSRCNNTVIQVYVESKNQEPCNIELIKDILTNMINLDYPYGYVNNEIVDKYLKDILSFNLINHKLDKKINNISKKKI